MLSSKKAIVAIFAVALMLFSSCLVIFVDESHSVDATTNEGTISIKDENNELSVDPAVEGFTVDKTNKVVTISTDYTASADKCINISYDLAPFTIKVDGKHTLTANGSSSGYGIYVCNGSGDKSVDVTIKGVHGTEDCLTVIGNGSTKSIGIYLDGNATVRLDDVTVVATGGEVTSSSTAISYGVFVSGTGTHLGMSNGAVLKSNGGAIKGENGGNTAGLFYYRTWMMTPIQMVGSQIYATGGDNESGNSYGLYINNGDYGSQAIFDGCKIIAKGKTSAVFSHNTWGATEGYVPMNCLANIPYVYGSTDNIEYTEITGDYIQNTYKTVSMSPDPLFTVTYDIGEGATGDIPGEEPQEEGDKFIVKENTATKEGCTFTGWKDDGGTVYQAGDEYTVGTSNVTLTAQWKQGGSSHTVTYDSNGATSGTVPTQDPVATGGTFTVATPGDLAKTGYTFGGWSDGSKYYFAGETYTVGNKDVTLKAIWNKVEENMSVTTDGSGRAQVTIPADSNVKTLKVSDGSSSISFGSESVNALKGKTLTVTIMAVNAEDVYEVVTKVGNESFTGKMTISFQYDSSKGTPQVYWRNGTTDEKMASTFDPSTGLVSFETNHNSTYVVKYTAEPTPSSSSDNGIVIGVVFLIAILFVLYVALIGRND